jgi:hypothetical protein
MYDDEKVIFNMQNMNIMASYESTNMFICMIRSILGENSRETLFGGL